MVCDRPRPHTGWAVVRADDPREGPTQFLQALGGLLVTVIAVLLVALVLSTPILTVALLALGMAITRSRCQRSTTGSIRLRSLTVLATE